MKRNRTVDCRPVFLHGVEEEVIYAGFGQGDFFLASAIFPPGIGLSQIQYRGKITWRQMTKIM
jgi:hypothetical protein